MDQFDIIDRIFYYSENDLLKYRQVCSFWLSSIDYHIQKSEKLECVWFRTHLLLVQFIKDKSLLKPPKGTKINTHFEPRLGLSFKIYSFHDTSKSANFLQLITTDYTGFRFKQPLLKFTSIKYFGHHKYGVYVVVEILQKRPIVTKKRKFFISFSDFMVKESSFSVSQLVEKNYQIHLTNPPNPFYFKIFANPKSDRYLEFYRECQDSMVFRAKLSFLIKFPFEIDLLSSTTTTDPKSIQSIGNLEHLIDFGDIIFLLKHDGVYYKAKSLLLSKTEFSALCPHSQKFILCDESTHDNHCLLKLNKVIDF